MEFRDKRHQIWAKLVKERDQYRCICCGKSNTFLHSHHLNSWDHFINDRYNIQNGVCICQNCHIQFHSRYLKGNNTRAQFEEFQALIKLIESIAIKNIKEKIVEPVKKEEQEKK